ncbi:hypothetical protein [Urechidicola vernalis]|uniref:Uncharacterized protein n=1 Tax=Urechidicola vernalis TaxID=3075600 RepID=A0ABU2Y5T5_9FLAO|nr:hypothetical protein [Urechidicola sp. P050]MDT0553564.1 hypothetical protein [Urechidicola sp. P050]
MLPFRTEIRNSPKEQTIKIYVKDITIYADIKNMLDKVGGIKFVEIQDSLSRNRVDKNITIFRNDGVNINDLKLTIDGLLDSYFAVK